VFHTERSSRTHQAYTVEMFNSGCIKSYTSGIPWEVSIDAESANAEGCYVFIDAGSFANAEVCDVRCLV
jgi:hypothetical protein